MQYVHVIRTRDAQQITVRLTSPRFTKKINEKETEIKQNF